jgi:hypothetical protein
MLRKFLYLSGLVSILAVAGCTEANQAARNVGNPVGQVVRVPQSITEGAAEGFVGNDANPNPYGR